MIGVDVFDVDESVCEAHDINSVFNARNFTRFCKHIQNENNEQERKGRRRVEEWLIAGRQTKWEPETVGCQNYYRFILYLLPWDLPHIHPLRAEQKKGERWKSMGTMSWVKWCERISKRSLKRWVRDGGPESENSNISWVLFRSTFCTLKGALCACLYICPPHVGLQWVGCTFPCSARYLSPGNISEWSDNSVYNETEREDIDSDTSDT